MLRLGIGLWLSGPQELLLRRANLVYGMVFLMLSGGVDSPLF